MAVPTPKITFGVTAGGKSFAATRRGGLEVQRRADYRNHFPVGVFCDMAAFVQLDNFDGTTSAAQPNNVTGLRKIINHPTQGLKANNLRYLYFNNAGPYFHVTAQNLPGLVEVDRGGGDVYIAVFGVQLKVTVDVSTALVTSFYDNAGAPNDLATATPLAQQAVDVTSPHPSILAYSLADDVGEANRGPKIRTMIAAFQDVEPHGRPASAVITDTATVGLLGSELDLLISYRYPAGRYASGADTAEGDFHRSTFSTVPNLGGGGGDWVDSLRQLSNGLPADAFFWLVLQVHADAYTQPHDSSHSSHLRYPTDRELRMQFWIAVGEGMKGMFWFTYGDFNNGVGDEPMLGGRPTALAVAKELSDRLNPEIRERLLRSVRITTPFTASGGGSTGYPVNYPNAYVSALYDEGSDLTYCVLCNHSTSTANVTVSSGTLTGALISLETGARYRLGTDAISLPALDGTILIHDPEIGVPATLPDLGVDVETVWWAGHWANPASSQYRPPSAIRTHPNVVNVAAGANLQAAIDAAPDYTTFVLDHTGTFARCELIERRGMHFISSSANNPAQRPTCRGFDIFGSRHSRYYSPVIDSIAHPGFVGLLLGTEGTTAEKAEGRDAWFDPPNDYLFRDIDFVSDGSLVAYLKFNVGGGIGWAPNHWYNDVAIAMRTVRDVLIERCSTSGYKSGTDQSTSAPNDLVETAPASHSGVFWGNMGITNVVIRDCDMAMATNAGGYGFPFGIFFDGARGVIVENVRFTGKTHAGPVLFLTNDDFTVAWRGTNPTADFGARNARFNVVANCLRTLNGGSYFVAITGYRSLIIGNTTTGSGTMPPMAQVATRCSKLAQWGHVYAHYGVRIKNNTYTGGNVTSFVDLDVESGWQCPQSSSGTYEYRGRVGQVTVTGNSVSGTVGSWVLDDTTPADGPHVISGNNKNDSGGVGV